MKFSDVEVGQKFRFLNNDEYWWNTYDVYVKTQYDGNEGYFHCMNTKDYKLCGGGSAAVELIEEPKKKSYYVVKNNDGISMSILFGEPVFDGSPPILFALIESAMFYTTPDCYVSEVYLV